MSPTLKICQILPSPFIFEFLRNQNTGNRFVPEGLQVSRRADLAMLLEVTREGVLLCCSSAIRSLSSFVSLHRKNMTSSYFSPETPVEFVEAQEHTRVPRLKPCE